MANPKFVSFGAKLASIRTESNLTRQAAAELSGYHVNTIKLYENGASAPSLGYLIALSKYTKAQLEPLVKELIFLLSDGDLPSPYIDAQLPDSSSESTCIPINRSQALKLIQDLAQRLSQNGLDLFYVTIPGKTKPEISDCQNDQLNLSRLAKNITFFRKNAGLTQEQLANLCGWSQSRLANYERCEREPSLNDINNIAKHLGISPSKILGICSLN